MNQKRRLKGMKPDLVSKPVFFSDLEGKTAIVTGAAQGIGREVTISLASMGCRVLAVDISEKVEDLINCEGKTIQVCRSDVSEEQAVVAMVDRCMDLFGAPNILVNVAAISSPKMAKDMSLAEWQATIDINLTSVFLCTQAVLPHLIVNGGGSIVNFSSVVASMGMRTTTHYSAAKAGVEGFSRSLALEVGIYGIRVNVVAPGMIQTKMLDLMPDQLQKKFLNHIPLGRKGVVTDMIGICLLLASEAGGYITGQTIHVNGGLYFY